MPDQFIVRLELGNDAMQTAGDVAGALRQIAGKLDNAGELDAVYTSTVRDLNGNTVGEYHVITPGGTPGEVEGSSYARNASSAVGGDAQ